MFGSVSLASKVPTVLLANLNDFDKQILTHSVPSTKEEGRICRYLDKIILHDLCVAERMVLLDAKTTERQSRRLFILSMS
jgi:hypothetical protein